jgi:predicted nucleic acid-binding protein
MTLVIVDASAFGPLILPDEDSDVIPEMLAALRAGNAIAPQHWPLEIANLMRMAVRRKRLDVHEFPEILSKLRGAMVKIDTETSSEAWGGTLMLATRYDLTAYDAAYLELAVRTGFPLATLDKALSNAAIAENIRVLCK